MPAMWFKVSRWFNEVRSLDRTFGYSADVYARRWKGAWVFMPGDPRHSMDYELLTDDEARRVVDEDVVVDDATAEELDWHFDYTLGSIVPKERKPVAWGGRRGGGSGGYRRKSMLHWNMVAREAGERVVRPTTLKPITGRDIPAFS